MDQKRHPKRRGKPKRNLKEWKRGQRKGSPEEKEDQEDIDDQGGNSIVTWVFGTVFRP